MRSICRRLAACAALVAGLQSGLAHAADALLRIVPDNIGACLVVRDLKGHCARFERCELMHRLQSFPEYQAWRNSEAFAGLQEARANIHQRLGVTLEDVRDQLLGDLVVLAIRPDPGGSPQEAAGLLISKVSNRTLLHQTLDAIQDSQRQKGTLTGVRQLDRGGVAYTEKTLLCPTSSIVHEYIAVLDDLLVVSNRRDLIDDVLALHTGEPAKVGTLAASPLFRQTAEKLPSEAAALLFVNTRAWDPTLARSAEFLPPPADARSSLARGIFTGVWRVADGFAAALQLRDGLVIQTFTKLNPALLPPSIAHMQQVTAGAPELLQRVPADAMLALVGRVDLVGIADTVEFLLPEPMKARWKAAAADLARVIGAEDFRRGWLARLGPDVGLYLTYASGDAARPEGLVALKVRPDAPTQAGPQPRTLNRDVLTAGLRLLAEFAAAEHNRAQPDGRARVESKQADHLQLTILTGLHDWPKHVQPAFAFAGDYLAVGSSENSLLTFARSQPQRALAANENFAQLRRNHFPEANQVFYANLATARRYLRDHRSEIAQHKIQTRAVTPRQADEELQQVERALALFDIAFLAQHSDSDGLYHTLGLIPHH